jgi:hypothetical protein
VTALHQTAPVYIGEVSCMDIGDTPSGVPAVTIPGGESKAQWWQDFHATDLAANQLTRIKAWSVFDATGSHSTWPLDSTPAALAGFRTARNVTSPPVAYGAALYGAGIYKGVPAAGVPATFDSTAFTLDATDITFDRSS